jgi:uncharacterized membrane-anchored protein YitT (DUF2179 family)
MTSFNSNISKLLVTINGTDESQSEAFTLRVAPLLLKNIHDILIIVLFICVMFGVGCSITYKQVGQLMF